MTKPDWTKSAKTPPEDLDRLLQEDHDEVDDNPPTTHDELASMTMKRRPGQRGPGKKPALVSVTLRLEPATLDAYRSEGDGWQGRMRDALKEAVQKRA